MKTPARYVLAFALAAASCGGAWSQESTNRTELRRAELAQHPDMELVMSMVEYKSGELLPRHFHHGLEAVYVVQGTLVQAGDKPPVELKTGAALLNLTAVPHGGLRIVGDQSLKMFTVHVVEKGKPLNELVE